MKERIVIVGGGVLGTMHAYLAHRLGMHVIHLEREPGPRGASVRNFGLVWVSGRADGEELAIAVRARKWWERIGAEVPDVGFRPRGSITIARTEAEAAICAAMATADAGAHRGFTFLDPHGVRAANPAVRGTIAGGLFSRRDASVEPGQVLGAIRAYLSRSDSYEWLPGRAAVDLDGTAVRDHLGTWHRGDRVVLTLGANFTGIAGAHLSTAAIRRCRLQMMQTAPLGEELTTSIADGDSFRYYPAYRDADLASLGAQAPVAAEHRMQLLMVQRANGGLTIGDTHAYAEPFDFAVEEAPYEHLRGVAEAILGRSLPPVVRRWSGVYCETTDGSIYHRSELAPGITVVNAPGGRGMTCSPAIAEDTFTASGAQSTYPAHESTVTV
jgi:FAD dependent oxidoreductase TIGR03364